MSSLGYPDYQRITQWLGAPVDQQTGLAIGAGTHDAGPFALASWASVIVAVKPTGGSITVTVKQKISGGPATLELDTSFVVPAGQTVFESVVLFGDVVSLHLAGTAGGETVDYALFPSNTSANEQVVANAVINVQHNDALVAGEVTVDFEDAVGFVWTIVDDPAGTRVKVTPPARPAARLVLNAVQAIPSGGANTAAILAAAYSWHQDGVAAWAARGAAGAPVAVPEAGIWVASAMVQYAPAAPGARLVELAAGSALPNMNPWNVGAPSVAFANLYSVSAVFELAAGDTVIVRTGQDTGGPLNLLNAELALAKVG